MYITIITHFIVWFFIIFAFLIILSILIPLFLLFVWRIKIGRLGIKIWLITSILSAIIVATVATPIALNILFFHIRRRPYIKMLKSYVPAELQKEVPRWFFNDSGWIDSFNFALVYPYRICMGDDPRAGWLRNVRDDDPEIGGKLTHLTFDANLLVARVSPWGEKKTEAFWIVFEFSTGKFEKFAKENQALTEANRRGFSGKQVLEGLKTHYDRFVGDIQ